MPRKKKELPIEMPDAVKPEIEPPAKPTDGGRLPPSIATKVQLASILDVSFTTLQSYESKGLIAKIGSKVDVIPTMVKLVNHFRAAAANKMASGDLKEEKLQEEIRQLRLQNAAAEGNLVDIESVHTVIRKTLVGVADWLESLPDAFEQTGIISPGMTNEFIRVMDNQRELLLTVNLKDIGLSDDEVEPS